MRYEKLPSGPMWFCTKCVYSESATIRENTNEPTYEELLLKKPNPNKEERTKIQTMIMMGLL